MWYKAEEKAEDKIDPEKRSKFDKSLLQFLHCYKLSKERIEDQFDTIQKQEAKIKDLEM